MKKILIAIFLILVACSFAFSVQKSEFPGKLPLQLSNYRGIKSELVIYLTGDGGWNKFSQKLVLDIEKEKEIQTQLASKKYNI